MMKGYLGLTCIFLVFYASKVLSISNKYSAERPFNLSTPLSILSFRFASNEIEARPQWFDTTFGKNSIWYNASYGSFLRSQKLSDEELIARNLTLQRSFDQKILLTPAPCSIELLGYATLDVADPFSRRQRKKGPAFGTSSLQYYLQNPKSKTLFKWPCIHRALFENWRAESGSIAKHFWAVLFYCPPPNGHKSCGDLRAAGAGVNGSAKRTLQFNLTINLSKNDTKPWETSFYAKIHTPIKQEFNFYRTKYDESDHFNVTANEIDFFHRMPKSILNGLQNPKRPKIAICGVVPYTSGDEMKRQANGAMLQEWIHYYSILQMKVILYDRDGANFHHIYNITHAKSLNGDDGLYLDLIYHNFTIRGLLDPQNSGFHYDNSEFNINSTIKSKTKFSMRFESQGFDKVNTLTYCRFEAKAVYGVEDVLVVDFDEFLFCPKASATPLGQKQYVDGIIRKMKEKGIKQVTFSQRIPFNKTSSPRDCIVNMTQEGKSIFHCYASGEYRLRSHSIKSLHLGLPCPLTGYHQACPFPAIPRPYNCFCSTYNEDEKCDLLHFSTQPIVFEQSKRYNGFNLSRLYTKDSDILTVVNYKNTENHRPNFLSLASPEALAASMVRPTSHEKKSSKLSDKRNDGQSSLVSQIENGNTSVISAMNLSSRLSNNMIDGRLATLNHQQLQYSNHHSVWNNVVLLLSIGSLPLIRLGPFLISALLLLILGCILGITIHRLFLLRYMILLQI